ncbi:hypothetical protein [Chondromyces crocatus]|uniref:Uncharacterized protein n=1 Tax=Chondromyces crocatus TaxID=52 RepID=A0A0K1EFH6_CHOCO|nr:hypothetical protein [Chondromyces crocatus]AKT39616.1 uncharacterized protein CMC5_037650 [Chondromyces crocatus]
MTLVAVAPSVVSLVDRPLGAGGRARTAGPEIDLFIHHLSWLGTFLEGPSRLAVMSWVGRMLRAEVREQLHGLFQADHPLQVQAEMAILRLLNRAWQKRAPRYALLDVPERDVDWPRTYLEELTRPPARYWARETSPLLDADMLGALCSLASSLLELGALSLAVEGSRRSALREELRVAIARVARDVGNRRVPFTLRHEQRLLRADDDARRAALAIRAGLAFWRGRFGGEGDALKLREIGEQIQEADLKHQRRTLYSLLELTSALGIARAALETREEIDLPEGVRWTLEDVDDRDQKNVPRLRLRSGALTCRISKEPPEGDMLVSLLAEMGLKSTGSQPDIVMTFSRTDPSGREKSLFVLADAKRNAASDGRAYLSASVDAAVGYAVSFGHRMGLRFHPGGEGRIDGDVLPAVTLFCQQGVKKIGGAGPDEPDILGRLRGHAALPAVLALDMDHFFSGVEPYRWRTGILGAWFGRIARQASVALQRTTA